MRWKGRRQSSNVEDRRGRSGGFGGVRIPMPRRRGGKISVWTIIIGLVAVFVFKVDPIQVLSMLAGGGMTTSTSYETPVQPSGKNDEMKQFIATVLADTEDTWNPIFQTMGQDYREPRLVLFSGAVQSACGFAQSAMGPFYCPGDEKVYIDLSFYEDLKNRHGAPGDFAQAYVVAHEIGHHVQNLLGISGKVQQYQRQLSKEEGNRLSVRLELQADCFSGVWANHTERAKQVLEAGDVDEALKAAAAIGDDRLQKQSRGYITPDSFTHGSSAQRVRWFNTGLRTGSIKACDTFAADSL